MFSVSKDDEFIYHTNQEEHTHTRAHVHMHKCSNNLATLTINQYRIKTFEINFAIAISIKYVYNTLNKWILMELWQ